MEYAIVLLLILMNGVFSMSEMAVVSSRKARLRQWADEKRTGAKQALALAEEPGHFLSTIQVGITAIGVLSGVFGEATLAGPLSRWLSQWDLAAPYAQGLATAIVVTVITVLSLIFGELVPKRLALGSPEAIASAVAGPFGILARVVRPLVSLLSAVTNGIVALFGANAAASPPVTEEEIKVLMEQGAEAGVFEQHEHEIVGRLFALDQRRIGTVMTPRSALVSLREDDPVDSIRAILRAHSFSHYPTLDRAGQITGLLRTKSLVDRLLAGEAPQVGPLAERALFVPESLSVMQLLESFKAHRRLVALVVDEYGTVQGLVTMQDVLESLVGDIGTIDSDGDPEAVRREDGSWLMSGAMEIARFRELVEAAEPLPGESAGAFETLGGLAMYALRNVPKVGDRFVTAEFHFEVVDMDRQRVDKLMVARKGAPVA